MISQTLVAEKLEPTSIGLPTDDSTIIRSLVELKKVEQDWCELMTPAEAPFQTFSWNLAWYRNFSDCCDEIIVFISRDGGTIFPLYRQGKNLRFAGDNICDYQDAVAGNIDAVRTGFEELLEWSFGKNYGLDFYKLSTRGYLYQVINEMSEVQSHFKPLVKLIGPCPYFKIGETPETRLAHLPGKFRAELRRKKRRIMEGFPGTTLQFHKTREIEEQEILEMVRFHSDNFRFSGSNPMDDPRLHNFLLEIRDRNEIGLCVSRLGNKEATLAMDLIFLRGDRLYGYLTAFNCDQARLSPGSCLLTDRLDLLVEQEGIKIIDFLCGSERYKYSYATDEYSVKSIRLAPRTFTGASKIFRLRTEYRLRRIAKAILAALKLR